MASVDCKIYATYLVAGNPLELLIPSLLVINQGENLKDWAISR